MNNNSHSYRVHEIDTAVSDFVSQVDQEQALLNDLGKRIIELEKERDNLIEETFVLEQVSSLFHKFSEEESIRVLMKMSEIITYALKLIFKEKFVKFKFNEFVSRNQYSLKPMVSFMVNGKLVTSDIMSAHGGGPADVIGFLLKLLVLVFQPSIRPVLFLDEAFSHLSAEYVPVMGEVIKKLVEELGKDLQIILITHQKEFREYGDIVYEFSKPNDKTVVKRLL